MLKIFKYFLLLAALLVLLVVLAAVLIPMFVDVNDYKDQISERIKQSTGYDVHVQGEIDLSLVPWLGLSLGRTSVANPPGFEDGPMLSLDQLQIRIKFWPLFTGSLEADKIVLKGFQAGFIVNEQGGKNWIRQAALQDKSAPESSGPQSDHGQADSHFSTIRDLQINGLEINDARVSYQDRQQNQSFEFTGFNFRTGSIVFNQPFKVEADTDFSFQNPARSGRADLSCMAMLRPEESRFELENFILNLDLQQGFTARPARDTRITADISVDGKAKTFDLSDFNARILDAALSGRATIDSSGKVPDISFDFNGKDIHVDHLVPAAPSKEQDPGKGSSPEAAPSSEPLDTSFLQAFTADGKIKLENIHSQGLTVNELSARIRSENGQMDIDPVKIILYQGVMDAALHMYQQGNALGLNVDQQLKGFQTGTFLKDLMDKDFFTGTLNLESSLQTSGRQNQEFLNNLAGTAEVDISDGIIKGLDLEALIRQAFALAAGEIDKIADSGQGSTPFTSLQADFAVKNGIARSSNLTLTSPVLGLKGTLAANLPESSLSSSASLSLDGALQQELQSRYELKDLSIPLKAEGPFDNIRVSVDKEALISSLAKQKGQDALDKILDKALPSSRENQDNGSDPAESMKGLLKNLMPGN